MALLRSLFEMETEGGALITDRKLVGTVKIASDLRKAVRQACLDLGITQTGAVDAALKLWLRSCQDLALTEHTAPGDDSRNDATFKLAKGIRRGLVEEFIRLLEDDSATFREFRELVIGVLTDRIHAGEAERAKTH